MAKFMDLSIRAHLRILEKTAASLMAWRTFGDMGTRYEADGALCEVAFGNAREALQRAETALGLSDRPGCALPGDSCAGLCR